MPKALFKTVEQRELAATLEKYNAILGEPGLRQGGRKKIRLRIAPKHLALGSSGNAGDKRRRGGSIYRSIGTPGHFMKGADGKPPLWKTGVDSRNTERHDGLPLSCSVNDALQLVA